MKRRSLLALAPAVLAACYTTPTIAPEDAFAVVELAFET
jgi:hypothetical protein